MIFRGKCEYVIESKSALYVHYCYFKIMDRMLVCQISLGCNPFPVNNLKFLTALNSPRRKGELRSWNT